jgi:hypothetical protein
MPVARRGYRPLGRSSKENLLKSVDVGSGYGGELTLPRMYYHGREAGLTRKRVGFTDQPVLREEVGARPGTVSN